MSAEATTATGFSLLAQDVGKALVEAQKRINDLERELDQADALIASLRAEVAER